MCVPADNPTQITSVSVAVKVLDVNDNPPSLTHYLEAYVCENAKAGQVQRHKHPTCHNSSHCRIKNDVCSSAVVDVLCLKSHSRYILYWFIILLHQTA